MSNYLNTIRNNPSTSRAGEFWSIEEDELLMNKIKNNGFNDENINNISNELKRTITSVRFRVLENAIKYMYLNNISDINIISNIYNININDLEKYIQLKNDRKEWKNITSRITKKRKL